MTLNHYFERSQDELAKSRTLLDATAKELNRIHERLNCHRKFNENTRESVKQSLKDEADDSVRPVRQSPA